MSEIVPVSLTPGEPCPACQRLLPKATPGPTIWPGKEVTKVHPNAPTIAVGIPTRGAPPIEFMLTTLQLMTPLNTRVGYIIQKGDLPGMARNKILQTALEHHVEAVFFLDDDVLVPDIALYRLWSFLKARPDAAAITGIVPTKIEPVEPLLYGFGQDGADWDWPLGVLKPVHSAGAGCVIVRMSYVAKLQPRMVEGIPAYFDDVVEDVPGTNKKNIWGQDRYFFDRLKREAGGEIYADTGLLTIHWQAEMNRGYSLPPDSPCFQQVPKAESYVPLVLEHQPSWRRLIPPQDASQFLGYINWVQQQAPPPARRMSLLDEVTA